MGKAHVGFMDLDEFVVGGVACSSSGDVFTDSAFIVKIDYVPFDIY